MRKIDRTGEIYITNQGYRVVIVEYITNMNVTVKFETGLILYNVQMGQLFRKSLQNPYHPTKYGIGWIGQGKYISEIDNAPTKEYDKWHDMFRRCYSSKHHEKNPTYKMCSVSSRWHCFQNFGTWFDENYNPETMQGWHLDKDVLVKGNKIYSPETCCLVPVEINSLFTKTDVKRGKYPIGVREVGGRFYAHMTKNGRSIPLGGFTTPEGAFQAYKTAKESWIKEVAEKWKLYIPERCYEAMYAYQVEITD